MKGLIIKDFLVSRLAFFVLIFSLVWIISPAYNNWMSYSYYYGIDTTEIFLLAVVYVVIHIWVSFFEDGVSKSNILFLTTPVSRTKIVICKYIFAIIIITICALVLYPIIYSIKIDEQLSVISNDSFIPAFVFVSIMLVSILMPSFFSFTDPKNTITVRLFPQLLLPTGLLILLFEFNKNIIAFLNSLHASLIVIELVLLIISMLISNALMKYKSL